MMNQNFKDLTTLDNMLRLRVAEVTFECLFSLNSTGVCFCVTLLNHATKRGLQWLKHFEFAATTEQKTQCEMQPRWNIVFSFFFRRFFFTIQIPGGVNLQKK